MKGRGPVTKHVPTPLEATRVDVWKDITTHPNILVQVHSHNYIPPHLMDFFHTVIQDQLRYIKLLYQNICNLKNRVSTYKEGKQSCGFHSEIKLLTPDYLFTVFYAYYETGRVMTTLINFKY